MSQKSKNMIPLSHDKGMTCENCHYKSSYFLEEDENETLNAICLATYFNLINDVTIMKDNCLPEQVYLIIPRFEKLKDGYGVPQFVINTLEGIVTGYAADIKKSLYNKLLLILAKSSMEMAMLPLALVIKKKTIYAFVKTAKQNKIVNETFPATEGYKLIPMNVGADRMPHFIPQATSTSQN